MPNENKLFYLVQLPEDLILRERITMQNVKKKKKGLVYYDDLKFLLSKKINDEEIGSSPSPGFSLFTYKTSQHICTLGFE